MLQLKIIVIIHSTTHSSIKKEDQVFSKKDFNRMFCNKQGLDNFMIDI